MNAGKARRPHSSRYTFFQPSLLSSHLEHEAGKSTMLETKVKRPKKPRAGEPITIEELMRLPDDGYKYERVKGVLKASPAGHEQEDSCRVV